MIKIEKLSSFNDISSNDWNALLDSCEKKYIFQTYEFQSIWWRHFGEQDKKRNLLLLLAKENDSIIGIAPLMAENIRLLRNPVIKFIGTPICDYMDFIIPKNRRKEIILSFFNYLKNIRFLEIDLLFIPEDSMLLHFDEVQAIPIDICPYIKLENNWEATYDSLNKTIKKYVARRERAIAKAGKIEFCSIKDKGEINYFLDEYFSIHVMRWKDYEGRYSQFQYASWRAFVREICATFFPKGYIDLSCLKLNSNTIASHFGFIYDKIFHWYMPAYNPAYSKYSPGNVFIMHLLKKSCENGLLIFDFLRGDEPYKIFWTDKKRYIYNCLCYHDAYFIGKTGRIIRITKDFYLKHIKRNIKKISPFMWLWYKIKEIESRSG